MSALLMDSRFVAVFPRLVRALEGDMQAAAILQSIHYRASALAKGEDWLTLLVSEIATETGLGPDQAQRATARLQTKYKLLIQDGGRGRARRWRIDYAAVAALKDGDAESRQSEQAQATGKVTRNRSTGDAESRPVGRDSASALSLEDQDSSPQTPRQTGGSKSRICINGSRSRDCGFIFDDRRCRRHPNHNRACPECHQAPDEIPEWCGDCDPRTRLIDNEAPDGTPVVHRCPTCHPSVGLAPDNDAPDRSPRGRP